MDFSLSHIVEFLSGIPQWVTLTIVAVGSGLEYIIPPFPGDTSVVAAATIAAFDGVPPWLLVLLATLGSIVGAMLGWKIGDWFVRSGYLNKLKPEHRATVDRLLGYFEKYGAICLAFNRVIPGFRSFFFIAAAMARIPLRTATFWAGVSGLIWSTLMVYIGVALANNVERLDAMFRTIQVWGAAVAVVVAFLVWSIIQWRKRRAAIRAHAIDHR